MEDIVEFEPTEIVKISVGELTAPVETGVELSKLFVYEKKILSELFKDIDRDEETNKMIIPPDVLKWAKEVRLLAKDINDMTKGVQEKAIMKKIDIVGEIYKKGIKNMDDKKLIKLVKNLENGNSIDVTPESKR